MSEAAQQLEPESIISNELVLVGEVKAIDVFSTDNGLEPLVQQARDIVASFEHDMTSYASRKRTASLAHKVAQLKTRLDGMGKELVSDWKAKSKLVDNSRKQMRDALDELKVDARMPLDEWEAEQVRIATEKIAVEKEAERKKQVDADHEFALLLNEKVDAELAEQARLEEERLAAEEEARIAAEEEMKRQAAEQAKREAEAAAEKEHKRIEQEKADAEERAADAERQRIAAEERAKIEAEQAEQRRIQAEKQAKKDAKAAAENARKEQIRLQQEKEKVESEKQERREANKRHVSKIMGEAKKSIMAIDFSEDDAKRLVVAIQKGEIKNVTINF